MISVLDQLQWLGVQNPLNFWNKFVKRDLDAYISNAKERCKILILSERSLKKALTTVFLLETLFNACVHGNMGRTALDRSAA